MSPMSRPLESRSRVNCHSTMRGDLLRVLDAGQRPERGLPAVLVGDRGGQLDLVPPPVEGVDHGGVLLAEVTRTRKVRRGYVAEKYATVIDAFYGGRDEVELTTTITYEDGRQAALRSLARVQDAEEIAAHG